jgi:putative ABC transport system substrate-binding protein
VLVGEGQVAFRDVTLSANKRLAAITGVRTFADAEGLMAYGPNYFDLYKRAAAYVDKILKGAKPADLPVEQPTKFEFVVNLKTANILGIDLPTSLLLRADEVIE